ncbi:MULTISPECIES: NAD(P)/FAD-dependent oxidoreductase [unclassified Haladaptatus]|uniref:NAD(P)/FAD-dependent oxidoreductase n=1 Tax=unclassified Haladaptatus TaxID=2622732 RepID=UPI0023E8029E|nr:MULTISPECIES: FAD-dependent oxidoreductase [unclassified Haladaptatus]
MRVLVLGAGYAGLTLAYRLERSLPDHAELALVDDTGTHLIQHELHRVIRRPALAEAITIDLADIFDRATVVTDRVSHVDTEAKRVELEAGESLDYDLCAVCLGAETAYYGLPGLEEHATPLKTVGDATTIHDTFVESADDDGHVLVCGAGLSGIQAAGELAALAAERGWEPKIRLLEQAHSIAPGFPENFRVAVRDALTSEGVIIETETTVTSADDDEVHLEDGSMAYDQLLWTGGIAGPEALSGERRRVRSTMEVADGTFVVGDAADVIDADGQQVPASAQSAIREARAVAKSIERLATRDTADGFAPRLEAFRFDSPGWIVTVGEQTVAQVGPTIFTGTPALALKASIGAGYLTQVGAVQSAIDLVRSEFAD